MALQDKKRNVDVFVLAKPSQYVFLLLQLTEQGGSIPTSCNITLCVSLTILGCRGGVGTYQTRM